MPILQAGKLVPMFTLPTSDGNRTVQRQDLRGKAALLLLWMPPHEETTNHYHAQLDHELATWGDQQRAHVISDDDLPDMNHALTLHDANHAVAAHFFDQNEAKGAWFITDRYGELFAQGTANSIADLPVPATFTEWIEYVNMRCSG